MRARMNIITTQMNSLKDYCGVTTGPHLQATHPSLPTYHVQYSPSTFSRLQHHQITTIIEDDESSLDLNSSFNRRDRTPFAGYIVSESFTDASGVGQLDRADKSVQSALTDFQENDETMVVRGFLSGGIGTFHTHLYEQREEIVEEPERLIIHGQQIHSRD